MPATEHASLKLNTEINHIPFLFTQTKILLLGALIVLLTGCGSLSIAPPEVNLMQIEVADITLSHVNLVADLRVYNPNILPLTVDRVDYDLYLNDIKIISGLAVLNRAVPAQKSERIPMRLSGAYWNMIRFLNQLDKKQEVSFALTGRITIMEGGFLGSSFPFKAEGVIPFLKAPANQSEPLIPQPPF